MGNWIPASSPLRRRRQLFLIRLLLLLLLVSFFLIYSKRTPTSSIGQFKGPSKECGGGGGGGDTLFALGALG